jgi:hypothetical protein
MAEDSNGSQSGPARLSVSGSSTTSDSGIMRNPLMPNETKHERVFKAFFAAALSLRILKPFSLLEAYPPARVLKLLKEQELPILSDDEVQLVITVVHEMTKTEIAIIKKRFDAQRHGEDISAYIDVAPNPEEKEKRADKFVQLIGGVEFFQSVMTRQEMYFAVMNTLWMTNNIPNHQAFAGQLVLILIQNEVFGNEVETLYQILKAMGHDLMGDRVPAAIRGRLWSAVLQGGRNRPGDKVWQHPFEKQFGGIPVKELSMAIPPDIMGNVFVMYCEKLGIKEQAVDKKSEPPPPLLPKDDSSRYGVFSGMGGKHAAGPPPLPTVVPRPDNKPPDST